MNKSNEPKVGLVRPKYIPRNCGYRVGIWCDNVALVGRMARITIWHLRSGDHWSYEVLFALGGDKTKKDRVYAVFDAPFDWRGKCVLLYHIVLHDNMYGGYVSCTLGYR